MRETCIFMYSISLNDGMIDRPQILQRRKMKNSKFVLLALNALRFHQQITNQKHPLAYDIPCTKEEANRLDKGKLHV